MAYHLQHEEHLAMVQAAVSSYSEDILLVSLNGEQVMANKILLVLYSPILRELLLSEKSSDSTAISLPLSTEAIVALLDLLAKGRTFSSKDAHLLEVVEAGALLGLSLVKLQLGSRKVKTFKRGKCDLRGQGADELEGHTGVRKRGGRQEGNKNPAEDSIKVEICNDYLGELNRGQTAISGKNPSTLCNSAQLEQNIFFSPNYGEKSVPFEELTKNGAISLKLQLLNPCLACDKDFIYPSLLNHHQKSVHRNELLNDQESKGLQCDSCQFSTPKLAFLKTHNKFMHPKT